MNKTVKNNKGFAAQDALIAVLIITLFAGIIATLLYNIYLANTSLKRLSKADLYIVDTFEYIDLLNFDDVTIENLQSKYANLVSLTGDDKGTPNEENLNRLWRLRGSPQKGYTLDIALDTYVPEGEQDSLDLVRKITMSVEYKVGDKNQKITMTRIKAKEMITS